MTFDLRIASKIIARIQFSASVASIRNEQTRSVQAAPRALEGQVEYAFFLEQSIAVFITTYGSFIALCIRRIDHSSASTTDSTDNSAPVYRSQRSNAMLTFSTFDTSRAHYARHASASLTSSINDTTCDHRSRRSNASLAISIDDIQLHISQRRISEPVGQGAADHKALLRTHSFRHPCGS
jgi:hypothetical protein